MTISLFFRPRVSFSVATAIATMNLCRAIWRAATIFDANHFATLGNNTKAYIVIGMLGNAFVLFLSAYSLVKFEVNRVKLEDIFRQLGSEIGVGNSRKMWVGGFYLACICVVASFLLYDLVDRSIP
jgi:hypothetical protein